MFAHRLVVDAAYRFFVSLVVLVVGGFMMGYMASHSVLWWFVGSILSMYLLEDCILKWVYLRRQMNYTEQGRPYPHFLVQLAELYPTYIHIPETNDVPPDNHEEPLI